MFFTLWLRFVFENVSILLRFYPQNFPLGCNAQTVSIYSSCSGKFADETCALFCTFILQTRFITFVINKCDAFAHQFVFPTHSAHHMRRPSPHRQTVCNNFPNKATRTSFHASLQTNPGSNSFRLAPNTLHLARSWLFLLHYAWFYSSLAERGRVWLAWRRCAIGCARRCGAAGCTVLGI